MATLDRPTVTQKRLLNVGGGHRDAPLPDYYSDWLRHWLDIDAGVSPDICGDARQLVELVSPGSYDAIYCSHNIEHYYPHDVPKVLGGFLHALKPDGFAEIRCPDLGAVMQDVVARKLDIDSVLYTSPTGHQITVRDVIYGYGVEIERSGNDFYAHKTGFTQASLMRALQSVGFKGGGIASKDFNLIAYAFKAVPSPEQRSMLGL
jgi:hypothetical protein